MRILFVLPKLSGGGAEATACQVASGLASRGHDVHVVCLGPSKGAEYHLDSRIVREGVLSELAEHLTPLERWRKLEADERRFRRFVNIRRRFKPDCTVSFLERSNDLNTRAPRVGATVASVRNNYSAKLACDPDALTNFTHDELCAASRADRLVAISRYVAFDQVRRFGADIAHTQVIYNPCDASAVRDLAAKPLPPEVAEFTAGHQSVCTVARFVRQKGQDHLLRAFALTAHDNPSARLVLVGDGPLRADLEALAEELGLAERVLFTGWLENPYGVMAACDAFAFTSLFEGLGNVLLEAMACGTPIVTADCHGGPRELVAPDLDPCEQVNEVTTVPCGLLTPPFPLEPQAPADEAEHQFANALSKLLDDPGLRDRCSAAEQERVKGFSPETILDQWENLLLSLS